MFGKKAARPDGGDIYHGGCDECTTPQKYCQSCKYFKFDACDGRPDYNSKTIIDKVMSGEKVAAPTVVVIEGVEYRKVSA